jgi:hypothetical protein
MIFFNDHPHFLVVEADEEGGWMDVLARDREDKYIIDGDRARLQRIYGKVRIEVPE